MSSPLPTGRKLRAMLASALVAILLSALTTTSRFPTHFERDLHHEYSLSAPAMGAWWTASLTASLDCCSKGLGKAVVNRSLSLAVSSWAAVVATALVTRGTADAASKRHCRAPPL